MKLYIESMLYVARIIIYGIAFLVLAAVFALAWVGILFLTIKFSAWYLLLFIFYPIIAVAYVLFRDYLEKEVV